MTGSDIVEVCVKALLGGVLVMVFALFAETLSPKRFAGVFAAAPTVALASLLVTTIASGPADAKRASVGMIAGGVGFVVYALAAPELMRKLGPLRGASAALLGWGAATAAALPLLALSAAAAAPSGSLLTSVAAGRTRMRRARTRPRPQLSCVPAKMRDCGTKDIFVRFGFGAATSLIAGLLTVWLGPFFAGIMLAFPAILLASLTLVAEEDGRCKARDDARGATFGSLGLIAFAAVGAALFESISTPVVFMTAAVAWLVTALGTFGLAWWLRFASDEKPED